MIWHFVLSTVGVVLAVLIMLETLRPKPMWLRPKTSASPRQRRWLGFALLLVLSGNVVNGLNMADVANLGLLAFGLMLIGLVLLIAGILKGPTDEELERRERMLSREGN